jgi:hypothetical protein
LDDFQIFGRYSDFWKIFRFLDNPKTFDIWDTVYNSDNWEPEFMTIFVVWQLIVTLDSIRNSCDVLKQDMFEIQTCQRAPLGGFSSISRSFCSIDLNTDGPNMCVFPYSVHSEKPFCSSSCFKELPWTGFIPYQGLSGIRIDLDTVRLDDYYYCMI